MDRIQKFLLSLNKKEREGLAKILTDIRTLKLQRYNVKPLKGHKGLFWLRKGAIRILFIKGDSMGIIINIAYRKDAYKNLP